MENICNDIAKQSGGVLTEIYKDTLSPSLQPVGIMFSFLPRTIRVAFSRWEKWLVNSEESLKLTANLLKEKIENIPDDKICEPSPNVAIPAIQQLSYCENSDDLRELYANLLASSMNIDTKWNVHPAFVDIIKQLTPDEAKILKILPPFIMVSHPLIDVRIRFKNKGENTHISNFTTFGLDKIENKGNICTYIENLARLKLIEIPPLKKINNDRIYEELAKNPIVINSIDKSFFTDDFVLDYEPKMFKITNLGISFVKTCCK